jgi:Sulfatase
MRRWAVVPALTLVAALSGGTASARPPVVMVVFDEFPTISLLDSHGRIDGTRYPHFAALANDGVWFPNATASVDETGRAMETLLTGLTPERKRPRTFAENPHNLFTLLEGRYRLNVSEEATALCPRRSCPHAHLQGEAELKHELASGRPERFRRWLRSVKPSRKPTLYFKHVLFPHVPLRYFPSGHRYSDNPHEAIPGIVEIFDNRWLVNQAYQRHLLQLGFTDRLLGSLLSRLRARRLYDRSLVVVTADNGESFGLFGNRHHISDKNAANIALTPLFVKLPHQRRGRIVRRHVRTVDVLPTIAHVLRVRMPWRTQGKSALGRASRRIPSSVLMIQRSGRRFSLSVSRLRRLALRRLATKLRLFGSGDGSLGLYAIGPHQELLGTPLSTWRTVAARHTRASLNGTRALANVRRSSGLVPSLITGRIRRGARRGSRPLAFAVNGWLTSTAPTFHLQGSRSEFFSAMVPEAFLHDGANEVEVFAISSGSSGLRLARIF